MDIILTLTPKFELEYNKKAKEIDRRSEMSLVLTTERHAEARFLMNLLKFKFNEIPDGYISKINDADTRTLEKWGINLMLAKSLDDVFKN